MELKSKLETKWRYQSLEPVFPVQNLLAAAASATTWLQVI